MSAGRLRFGRSTAVPYTITTATNEIKAPFLAAWAGILDNTSWNTTTNCTTASELQTALTTVINNVSKFSQMHLIECDWDGPSTHSTMTTNVGFSPSGGVASNADSYLGNGGGVLIRAKAGRTPTLMNTLHINSVRGVQISGLAFGREYPGSGDRETQYGALVQYGAPTRPARPYVYFHNCTFGTAYSNPSIPAADYIGCFGTTGLCDTIKFDSCRFGAAQNIIKCNAWNTWLVGCDMQLPLQDYVNIVRHTFGGGYYAYLWLDRCMFRNPCDTVEAAGSHQDMSQTGQGLDDHLGYKVLYTNCIGHLNHTNLLGLEGGTQGCYNDDMPVALANNQFVMRDSFIFTTAQAGLGFYATAATLPSFVDSCTFNRAGQVPSTQDFNEGIRGAPLSAPNDGNKYLIITNTIAGEVPNYIYVDTQSWLPCKPMNTASVILAERPETVCAGGGVGFVRTSGKLSYDLPGETEGQSEQLSTATMEELAEAVWDLWQAAPAYVGWGAPDPRPFFP